MHLLKYFSMHANFQHLPMGGFRNKNSNNYTQKMHNNNTNNIFIAFI